MLEWNAQDIFTAGFRFPSTPTPLGNTGFAVGYFPLNYVAELMHRSLISGADSSSANQSGRGRRAHRPHGQRQRAAAAVPIPDLATTHFPAEPHLFVTPARLAVDNRELCGLGCLRSATTRRCFSSHTRSCRGFRARGSESDGGVEEGFVIRLQCGLWHSPAACASRSQRPETTELPDKNRTR
jgi:hypothetical protein